MKRILFGLVISALAFCHVRAQPLQPQRWVLSYDRQVAARRELHGPPKSIVRPERSRLTLVAKGDSVSGQLVKLATDEEPEWLIGEVRGVRKQNDLTLRVYKPVKPMGFVATQWDAVIAWLKETMHGITPTFIEMRLTTKGDDIGGTRSVISIDGPTVDGPRSVTGRREAP